MPRSGYSSGPTVYRKGTIPPSATRRGGPTPGRPFTPRDSPRRGVESGGRHHHGHHGHHGHGHGHFGFRFGFGGFFGYPSYFGSHFHHRPYYFGLGHGYYPYVYDPYYSPRSTGYRTVRLEAQGGLDLNVKPKDTQVFLNGYYIGTVGEFDGWPRYLWLDEDVHELIFYKEGYETVVREISIQPNVVINIKLHMQPGLSTSPEELTRYGERDRYRDDSGRDRRYGGREYGDREYAERTYGERDEADRDRYGDLPRRESRYDDREAAPGRERPSPSDDEVELATDAGHLVLQVSPPEASIYIDGRFVGIGVMLAELEEGLVMDEGEHRIQVLHPRYKTVERSFTVAAGKETQLGIALEQE